MQSTNHQSSQTEHEGTSLWTDQGVQPSDRREEGLAPRSVWGIGGQGKVRQLLPGAIRWLCLASGLGLLALLAVARYLSPSPMGYGTHQQLGLPPCTSMVLWGLPCPTCGMTTSWAWVARGNLVEAGRANLGGMMLAIIAIGFLPAACYFFIVGRATSGHWFSTLLAVSLVTSCCVTLLQWAFRLAW